MIDMMAPQVGVPKEVIAAWLGCAHAGAIPVTADIAASQQRSPTCRTAKKSFRARDTAGHVWFWRRTGQ
jgi:hypothetical protein